MTFSNVVASFSSHDSPISLQSPSISPSSAPANVDSTRLWMLGTTVIGQKVALKQLRELRQWAIQNVLERARRKRESWIWQYISKKLRSGRLPFMKVNVQNLQTIEQETLDENMRDSVKDSFVEN